MHPVNVQDVTQDNFLTIYTPSFIWDTKTPTPLGGIIFNAELSKAMGQKRFVIDARRLALLPLTNYWFLRLSHSDDGIMAIAPAKFQK